VRAAITTPTYAKRTPTLLTACERQRVPCRADERVRCEPWCGTRVRGWMVVVAVVSVRDDDGNVWWTFVSLLSRILGCGSVGSPCWPR
jgi:hypothetical protein